MPPWPTSTVWLSTVFTAREARPGSVGQNRVMTQLATPTATRLRRPSLRDSRFIIGVLLVLLSTVLGAVVLSRADATVPRYAAAGPLVPGQQVTSADLVRVDVRLGDLDQAYLSAEAALPSDTWVLRELRAGELVPVSALGPQALIAVQPVSLLVDPSAAASLVQGSVVDVYVNRPAKGAAGSAVDAWQGPERVLERVSVGRVEEAARVGIASRERAVAVLVPVERVKGLVADIDLGAKITLVLVPGSPTRTGS